MDMNVILCFNFLISAIDCVWAPWSTWSECSTTCGAGTRTKTRTKVTNELGGGLCPGQPSESEACNLKSCGKMCHEIATK